MTEHEGRRRWTRRAGAALAGALALGLVPRGAAAVAPDPAAPIATGTFCAHAALGDPFSDVGPASVHYDNVRCAASARLTQGLAGGSTFGPLVPVTREQMATFVARLLAGAEVLGIAGLQDLPDAVDPAPFVDVDPRSVHAPAIALLAAIGVVTGGPGGMPADRYGPTLPVTRAQMATFVNRAQQFLTGGTVVAGALTGGSPFPVPAEDFFLDDDADVHEDDINAVAAARIYTGDGADAATPGAAVTREQMASFLVRLAAVDQAAGSVLPLPSQLFVVMSVDTAANTITYEGTGGPGTYAYLPGVDPLYALGLPAGEAGFEASLTLGALVAVVGDFPVPGVDSIAVRPALA